MRCFQWYIFAALSLLVGCASGRSADLGNASSVYEGHVVAVREVTGSTLTSQITQIIGQPDYVSLASGQEVVVQLTDGEIKTFVPPQGALPAKLVAGDDVLINTTPSLKISLR